MSHQTASPAYGQTRSLPAIRRIWAYGLFAAALVLAQFLLLAPSQAQSVAFKQAIAQAAANDRAIAAFYKERDYQPIWTGANDGQRRRAFIEALRRAPENGLPEGRYDAASVRQDFFGFKSIRATAALEVETTRKFLQYARDIQSGILDPKLVDKNMTLRPPRRNRLQTLVAFSESSPAAFLRALQPSNPGYNRLLVEKMRLERIVGRGGWGAKVNARKLEPGQRGTQVVALRRRLNAMGYRQFGLTEEFGPSLTAAVKLFQQDHGLNMDGIAGVQTLRAINISASTRLMQVIVGLERLRWLNKPLGKRYILVNEAAFTAYVIDNGKPILTTRVVVGKAGRWRTPEFEKKMTYMVINPSWYVPASIATTEYLPKLKLNRNALIRQDLIMTDASGNTVNPENVDFAQYSQNDFPFNLRQPPSGENALGRVKFMFPNKHAIYLHDTPTKSLFGKDIRTFSHGCIRVQKPFQLAYTLLSKQSADPKALFDRYLATGKEITVRLKVPVPIYLVYRTAWVTPAGRVNFRADSYDVDEKVFAALMKAGVTLRGIHS